MNHHDFEKILQFNSKSREITTQHWGIFMIHYNEILREYSRKIPTLSLFESYSHSYQQKLHLSDTYDKLVFTHFSRKSLYESPANTVYIRECSKYAATLSHQLERIAEYSNTSLDYLRCR